MMWCTVPAKGQRAAGSIRFNLRKSVAAEKGMQTILNLNSRESQVGVPRAQALTSGTMVQVYQLVKNGAEKVELKKRSQSAGSRT